MDKIVFIIGVGRSGTTILQSLLNAHSQIVFLPESHFIYKYVGPQLRGKWNGPTDKPGVMELLQEDPEVARLQLDIPAIVDRFYDEKDKAGFAKLFEGIMQVYEERSGKVIVGDKYPLNLEYLPEICEVWPDAYILHIIRDPRDVMVSRIKAKWASKYPFIIQVMEYYYGFRVARQFGEDLFGEHYLEVKYEDLVDDPDRSLDIICRWLGVEFEAAMHAHHEKASELVASDERSWKENIFKPIIRGNKGKWKKELSWYRRFLTEITLQDEMKAMGYEIETSGLLLAMKKYPTRILGALFYLWKKRKHG